MDTVGRSRLAPLALAAVTIAAALSLGRIYDGAFVVPVLIAAVLPHALGALLRHRPLPVLVEAIVPVAALALFLVWATPASRTLVGIPTPDSVRALSQALADGAHTLRVDTPPIAGHGGALLIGLACVWLVAQVADALAFRSHAPYGAIVPSLSLFVVTAALGRDVHVVPLTLVYGTAVVIFLTVVFVGRIDDRRAPFGPPDHRSVWQLGLGGLALGLTALLVAGAVAPNLPGADAGALIDYRGLGGPKGPTDVSLYSPVADVTAQLRDQPNTVVFTVGTDSDVPHYWRMAALRRFENDKWEPDGTTVAVDGAVGHGDISAYERRTIARAPTTALRQRFDILAMTSRYLPAAYLPVRFDGRGLADDQQPRVIVQTDTLISTTDLRPGDSYRVISSVPASPTEAGQATLAARPAEPMPAPFVTTYTQLPDDVSPRVAALARQIVRDAGATTPFTQATAIQEYFSPANGFVYDLRPNLTGDNESADAMEAFLFSDDDSVRGHGYCVQFATAFTELTRSLGIPTRFAVGFTSGEREGTQWTVRGRNAHAWPEVWVPAAGWMAFEPTPGPPDQPFVNPDNPTNPPESVPPPTTPTATTATPGTTVPPEGAVTSAAPTVTAPKSDDGWSRGQIALLLAPVIVLAVGALVIAALLGRRRARRNRRRHGGPRRSTLGAWDEALEQLAAVGVRPDAPLTPTEFADRVPDAEVADPVRDLARRTTAAQWSLEEPEPEVATAAWVDVDRIGAALDRDTPWTTRLRRALRRPAPETGRAQEPVATAGESRS